jgi:nitrate reductase alpha subunit
VERDLRDKALTEIADHMIDAIQEQGPESIIRIGEPAEGGTQSLVYGSQIVGQLGGTITDVQAEINDFSPGIYITFGKFDPAASCDDWFHTDLMLCWQINPAYTSIPWHHFISEGRYRGAEVVVVAPDFNPTAPHADFTCRCASAPSHWLTPWPGADRRESGPLEVRRADGPAAARPPR